MPAGDAKQSASCRLLCTVLASLLLGLIPSLAARQARAPAPAPRGDANRPSQPDSQPGARGLAPVPFRAGERLEFRVLWSRYAVRAATIDFHVVGRRNFYGRGAWHFRAFARTLDTIRLVYPLDDQFDSYTAAADLTSLQYEMYLREQGRQHNRKWRMSTAGNPAPPDVPAARVLPGTRDPLSTLYALRAADWKATPEFRSPVFDGQRLYQIVARAGEPLEAVTVPAGTFAASRIDIEVFERAQPVASTRFSLWLAQDGARTPVLIEAEVPIGTARVELISR